MKFKVRKKILVIGYYYFASKLYNSLVKIDQSNEYKVVDLSGGFWQKLTYLRYVFNADVLYIVGGVSNWNKTLILPKLMDKKIVMHWVGTDVLQLRNALKLKKADLELINKSTHYCEVDWIFDELSAVNIQSKIVKIATFDDYLELPKKLPRKFAILSYVAAGRESFYGIDRLIQLAEKYSSIIIRIAGISKYHEKLPSNINLLGWISDMKTEFENATLYIRMTEHDGLAFSVLEALANGRYVAYNNKFPFTQYISDSGLQEFVGQLINEHLQGRLGINMNGYRFIQDQYSETEVIKNLAIELSR